MGACVRCGQAWPAHFKVCPEDGTSLTTSAPGGDGAALAQPATDETAELAAGTAIGEYVVEGKIGEGGMGVVYAATHPVIGKKAAIKVISHSLSRDTDAVQRFIQEARSVNTIRHINIVDVFAFGQLPDGRRYFVMEWLQGSSLAGRIAGGPMPPFEAVEVLDQIADALEAAHEKGIVHRDLKPDNIFLVDVRGGRQLVKLLDFGIAKLMDEGGVINRTRTGMMMGTPGYMSPEQARGVRVDHRTDVYALGAIAFELLTGKLPFDGESVRTSSWRTSTSRRRRCVRARPTCRPSSTSSPTACSPRRSATGHRSPSCAPPCSSSARRWGARSAAWPP
jgi:eukaryotic-like serine/threonine-protein kinase